MDQFRNKTASTNADNWTSNGSNFIAFSRGNKGFIAINESGDIRSNVQTGLSEGEYCNLFAENCSQTYKVGADGMLDLSLDPMSALALLAK